MLHIIKLELVRDYTVKTVQVNAFAYEGKRSKDRFESIIIYKGMGQCDLHKAYICTFTKEDALLAHNQLLHAVVEKIAELTFRVLN